MSKPETFDFLGFTHISGGVHALGNSKVHAGLRRNPWADFPNNVRASRGFGSQARNEDRRASVTARWRNEAEFRRLASPNRAKVAFHFVMRH